MGVTMPWAWLYYGCGYAKGVPTCSAQQVSVGVHGQRGKVRGDEGDRPGEPTPLGGTVVKRERERGSSNHMIEQGSARWDTR